MPTAKEFRDALIAAGFSPKLKKLLIAHYHASYRTVSAKQLARAVGYKGYQGVNLQYGKLSHVLGRTLQYIPTATYDDGTPVWTWVLATRPELAQALEELGWV